MNPQPALMALPILGLLSLLWLLASLTRTAPIQQFCLVTMFVAVTWAVLGTGAVRVLAFPLGLLLFTLPFGERVAPLFQEFTARFASKLLTLSEVHTIEGHVVSSGTPDGE
jgi:hypothetical protein